MKLSARLILAMGMLSVVSTGTMALLGHLRIKAESAPRALERLESHVRRLGATLETRVDNVRGDVLTIAGGPSLAGLLRARANGGRDPERGLDTAACRDELARLFHARMLHAGTYLQLRFIGAEDGHEITRVDRARAGETPRTVPDAELQPKGTRPYVEATLGCELGATFVSPIELNRERGRIEVPHIPVLRVGTPVADATGAKVGIIIVNVDMRPIFEGLRGLSPRRWHTSCRGVRAGRRSAAA
jgi:hypothetical protein